MVLIMVRAKAGSALAGFEQAGGRWASCASGVPGVT
jgi:hypothetical protein